MAVMPNLSDSLSFCLIRSKTAAARHINTSLHLPKYRVYMYICMYVHSWHICCPSGLEFRNPISIAGIRISISFLGLGLSAISFNTVWGMYGTCIPPAGIQY